MIPPTSQNPKEFEELLWIYRQRRPKNVLEIGSHEGGTLYYWLRYGQPETRVASIDNQRINSEYYAEWCNEDVECIYYTGLSQSDEAIKWAAENIAPIDWLFIDGGHSYEEVSEDYIAYSPMMNRRGVIAFHDILSYPPYNSQVSEFWDELKGRKKHTQEIIYPPDHGLWEKGPGIGVIYL